MELEDRSALSSPKTTVPGRGRRRALAPARCVGAAAGRRRPATASMRRTPPVGRHGNSCDADGLAVDGDRGGHRAPGRWPAELARAPRVGRVAVTRRRCVSVTSWPATLLPMRSPHDPHRHRADRADRDRAAARRDICAQVGHLRRGRRGVPARPAAPQRHAASRRRHHAGLDSAAPHACRSGRRRRWRSRTARQADAPATGVRRRRGPRPAARSRSTRCRSPASPASSCCIRPTARCRSRPAISSKSASAALPIARSNSSSLIERRTSAFSRSSAWRAARERARVACRRVRRHQQRHGAMACASAARPRRRR